MTAAAQFAECPPVAPEILAEIKSVLGEGGYSEDSLRVEAKLTEWRGKWKGHTPLLVLPKTTEELSKVVRICYEHGVAITPQGGNTGLVGGQIPFGEILVSLERMRTVRDVAPTDDTMVLEAGITLLEAQQIAEKAGRHFPLSLAAEGTATIGGVISTNAGGTAVLRYGVTRDLVSGLEVVLPNGDIFRGLKRLRKDNTGYDLKQMFIGAEGTLGIITAASLKLFPVMNSRSVAIVGFETSQKAIDLLARAKQETGGQVEAFELMGRYGLSLVLKNIPDTREPLEGVYPWYALIEVASGDPEGAETSMERLLGAAFEEELILDAAIAQNDTQAAAFWRLREEHSAAEKVEGAAWKHDISVPLSRMAEYMEEGAKAIEAFLPGARLVAFGHVGDGNVHFNVIVPEDMDAKAFNDLRDEGSKVVHDLVHQYEGSISAEHGLGRMKTQEALLYKDPTAVAVMRAVRLALDPKRIMNPHVLF
ncbi:FAD-binding oxidoreductase [Asticcacaulis endophyticus]|jgi:FAD/FMN-containing dehydrogenase|uniref:D-2-hydroxyacid dehydrogenase n=1 Tax=Asticcacaulis endophyticus TaxID=1395890 RepID=A0A918Q9S3_9CAUL|nr:FAD-binding oxidoreductase [Asticcacaulis endophyticus]GGZ37472.1 D-2-hydroxyacid dehydrogenase [Asticcacaulis endophyticus]